MFVEERRRGIYDVDAHTPSTITSHAPGYIDQGHELIVGLQTSSPLRRAIMPNGGLRTVQAGLSAYGFSLDPTVQTIFSQYRKTFSVQVASAYYAVLGNRDAVRNNYLNLESSRKNAERPQSYPQATAGSLTDSRCALTLRKPAKERPDARGQHHDDPKCIASTLQ